MADAARKVSVIIPAHNAEATIAETLTSARNQTHRNLEMLVVDDGSVDATADVVATHARDDPRIRLIRQKNMGVAAARNTAAAAATGEFIAPLDADDLWHPRKLELQLEMFDRMGPRVGLVYSWFALIDGNARVLQQKYRPQYEGKVLKALAYYNFIGTGSSAMIRREVFDQSPGYDPTLRARGGQGCEDWKLYFQIAEHHEFAVARAPLTGYRTLPDNMSSDVLQMLRSRDLATADLLPSHPELTPAFRAGRNRLSRFLFHRALRRGRRKEIVALLRAIGSYDPVFLVRLLSMVPVLAFGTGMAHVLGSMLRRQRHAPGFAELDDPVGVAINPACEMRG